MPMPGDQSATTLAAGTVISCAGGPYGECDYVFCTTLSTITTKDRSRHHESYFTPDIQTIDIECPTCGNYVNIDQLVQEHPSWA